uniref:Uncharacterized protein n=1 Tax=Chrysotila carterae TaxID=13221 RepID=A0A7S4B436_CHRCT
MLVTRVKLRHILGPRNQILHGGFARPLAHMLAPCLHLANVECSTEMTTPNVQTGPAFAYCSKRGLAGIEVCSTTSKRRLHFSFVIRRPLELAHLIDCIGLQIDCIGLQRL